MDVPVRFPLPRWDHLLYDPSVADMEEVVKTKRRIGRVLSVEREASKRMPERINIVVTFELRNGEKVKHYTSEIYPWTLLQLCRKVGLHLRCGVYNPQRLVGKDVWLLIGADVFRRRSYTRVQVA